MAKEIIAAQAPGNRWRRRGLAGLALMGLILMELILVELAALPAFAQAPGDITAGNAYVLNRDRSKILFSIGHFYVSTTEGRFTAFSGKLDFAPQAPGQGSATIQVSPASISTGNAARDAHLRDPDFFDVGQFPEVRFESTSLVRVSGTVGTLTGRLSLHGVVRPITLNVTLQTPDLNADRLSFSARGTLKRSDYGMNSYQGIIGDEVTLNIEAEFDRTR
jgi:polyisoprenoid-binding protein YceI